ncbi:unnamed protein product, partial [Cylicocyclus nassatus]
EFYKDFLYDWIEALQQLNDLTVTESQPRLVWSFAIFMGSIIVFIGCASLMLLSYRVVDPCYPKIPPRP